MDEFMDNTNYQVLVSMRMSAWERAKGELRAMLHTFWADPGYDSFDKIVTDFVKNMEDNF